MSDLQLFWNGLNWPRVTDVLLSAIPALICIVVHEVSHGLSAYFMGDETAKSQGRLSFNPIRHIDPLGLLMLAVFQFGWAKPVSVDMRNFKNPKRGMAITALAGPASNLLLAAVFMAVYGFFWRPIASNGEIGLTALDLIIRTIYCSIGLAIFNMLPIPPLDGSKALFSVLPDELYYKLMRYERFGMILMIALLFSGILNGPLSAARGSLFNVLFSYIAMPMDALAGNVF